MDETSSDSFQSSQESFSSSSQSSHEYTSSSSQFSHEYASSSSQSSHEYASSSSQSSYDYASSSSDGLEFEPKNEFPTSDRKNAKRKLSSSSSEIDGGGSSRRLSKVDADGDDDGPVRYRPLTNRKGKQVKIEESLYVCGICMDAIPDEKKFRIHNCSHIFCNGCITRHVAAKIKENKSVVQCPNPNCKEGIELEHCRSIIPKEVFDKWGDILCENVVVEAEKFFCPFKDCSAMLMRDGEEVVTPSECPQCNRLFCAQCKVSWHAGIDCEEFQRSKRKKGENGDSTVTKLAKKKGWRKCPNCSFYVERIAGCSLITCRFVIYIFLTSNLLLFFYSL
ncbi:hypothetical protein V8G54_001012 [Vigna mungo]|uniref:RBR-type E3 ubiquitin transferase n=1 Tax=Vigna mungo TaxID=3915 RepID=A0AAQ3P6H4_VIGMU